jgi:hypothetical protein
MTVGWSREEAVAATRTQLLRAGAVTDGYAGIELVERPPAARLSSDRSSA